MTKHILTRSADIQEDRRFAVHKKEIDAGASFPIHWHDYYEFEIVVSGQAQHIHNGISSVIDAGCSHLMCYNDFHSLTAITDMVLYSVYFRKEWISPKLAEHLEFHTFNCSFTPSETVKIVNVLSKMSDETSCNLPFHDIAVQNCMEEILIAFLRKQTTALHHATLPPPIQQAIIYTNEHYRSSITLEELADKLSLSPNYFGQLFKAEVGTTFHKYLNTLRLKFACNLLASSSLSVKEIAFSSGYNSLEYFMYIFKKHLDMTPLQYRTAQKNSLY